MTDILPNFYPTYPQYMQFDQQQYYSRNDWLIRMGQLQNQYSQLNQQQCDLPGYNRLQREMQECCCNTEKQMNDFQIQTLRNQIENEKFKIEQMKQNICVSNSFNYNLRMQELQCEQKERISIWRVIKIPMSDIGIRNFNLEYEFCNIKSAFICISDKLGCTTKNLYYSDNSNVESFNIIDDTFVLYTDKSKMNEDMDIIVKFETYENKFDKEYKFVIEQNKEQEQVFRNACKLMGYEYDECNNEIKKISLLKKIKIKIFKNMVENKIKNKKEIKL